mgnify:CR=1 FL=1
MHGAQVFIRYGTEQTSNVEFVGHYGFVDPRATEADRALVRMSADYLPALSHTTVEEDEVSTHMTDPAPLLHPHGILPLSNTVQCCPMLPPPRFAAHLDASLAI